MRQPSPGYSRHLGCRALPMSREIKNHLQCWLHKDGFSQPLCRGCKQIRDQSFCKLRTPSQWCRFNRLELIDSMADALVLGVLLRGAFKLKDRPDASMPPAR